MAKEKRSITELNRLYYSINEVAEIFGVHRNTIKNRINAKEIEAIKIGSQWRIPKEAIDLIRGH